MSVSVAGRLSSVREMWVGVTDTPVGRGRLLTDPASQYTCIYSVIRMNVIGGT